MIFTLNSLLIYKTQAYLFTIDIQATETFFYYKLVLTWRQNYDIHGSEVLRAKTRFKSIKSCECMNDFQLNCAKNKLKPRGSTKDYR